MKKKRTLFFLMILLIVISCKREYGDFYDPPKGQESEIYLQLSANPNLSTFVSAIDLVPGLKEELSSSGLFTVMAPDNEAFDKYFASNANYNSLEDIPVDEVDAIVKYHIMKWMLFQYDFMNPAATGNSPNVYKYETRSYVKYVDKSISGKNVPLFYTSKMAQVYTPNYWSTNNVNPGDYSQVYGNDAQVNTTKKLNIMGASAKEIDIAAGNGCVYILDKVLLPPNNIAQELDLNPEFETYNQILKKNFLTYTYDEDGTIAQGNNGDVNGDGLVDSLWTRQYDTHPFLDVENPFTTNRTGLTQWSLTAFVPGANAFQQYLDNKLLPAFSNNIDLVPEHTLLYLLGAHLSNSMEWPSSISNGMARNVLGDLIEISSSDISSVKMTSNGIFYTTNTTIEPKLFSAAPGPVFFSSDHWYFAEMLLLTNRAQLLTSDLFDLTVFAPSDSAFNAMGIVYDPNPDVGKPGFYDMTEADPKYLSSTALFNIVGNHILIKNKISSSDIMQTDGFYETWNGSYLATENGNLHGSWSILNSLGFFPILVDPDHEMSNGYYHGISKVIQAPSQSILDNIKAATTESAELPKNTYYRKFRELCSLANILDNDFKSLLTEPITELKANKRFTLFVPSNESIIAAQEAGLLPATGDQGSSDLSDDEKIRLAKYIRTFFVQQNEIFTDGKNLGDFLSARLNEAASTYGNDVFLPVTVSLPALTVTINDGSKANVIMDDKIAHPQNRICKDGVIHIIDNAFTSQY